MHLLTLGTDRNLFETESKVSRRIETQAALFESHTIIVFTRRSHGVKERALPRLRIIPTQSLFSLMYGLDAIRLGYREGKRAEIISSQDPFETGLAALILAWVLQKPLHIQVHTDFLSPHFGHTGKNRIRKMIARFVIPRARCVRVVSMRLKQGIEHRFGLKGVVVLPVYEPFSGEGVAGTGTFGFEKFFLIASRLEKEKDIATALRGFSRIAPHHTDTGLVIAGEGKERHSLEKMACNLGLENQVVCLGWRNDLPALLRSAAGFLSTSLFEGYGVSLIMAARAGVPIITTDVGVVGDILGREEVTVIPHRDPRAIASAIEHFLAEEESMQDRATRLRARLLSSFVGEEEYTRALRDSFTPCIQKP